MTEEVSLAPVPDTPVEIPNEKILVIDDEAGIRFKIRVKVSPSNFNRGFSSLSLRLKRWAREPGWDSRWSTR